MRHSADPVTGRLTGDKSYGRPWSRWFVFLYCYAILCTVATLNIIADLPAAYAWLQIVFTGAAWAAVVFGTRGQWFAVGGSLILTLGAPWGFFYLPPLAAIIAAVAAIRKGVTTRGRNR